MKMLDVYLYVYDTLADWEYGYAVAGINNPESQKTPGRFRVRTVAASSEIVTTMGGVKIAPELTIEQIAPGDSAMLVIPGGLSWDNSGEPAAIDLARAFLDHGVPVAAICGVTAGLARGGLLDNRRHTSNAREFLAMTGYAGAALYEDSLAVTDGELITASGIAPIDFARHIFQRLDLYSPAVLEAWYGLNKTGDPKYFYALMQASTPTRDV